MANRYIPPALRAQGQRRDDAIASRAESSSRSISALPVSTDLRGNNSASIPGDTTSSNPRGGSYNTRPHPRKSHQAPEEELYSTGEIQHYFWPQDDARSGAGNRKSKTLHDSAATPGALAYVLLFKDANPRWETDGIIYTKSSLELLPAQSANRVDDPPTLTPGIEVEDGESIATPPAQASNKTSGETETPELIKEDHTLTATSASEGVPGTEAKERHPIAVFTQVRRPPYEPDSTKIRTFRFTGYFKIANLQFLQPRSPELLRMLEQKWTFTNPRTGHVRHKQRDAKGWEESLKLKWAVVKFEKDNHANAERGKPQIEPLEDDDGGITAGGSEKKGVNELLRELRMKDGDATETAQYANVEVDDVSQQEQKLEPARRF
ncbi:hypothetical protein PV04_04323 [Phialophora macrospora]|uniref:Uncharacterized protein n=1 Tax=Phialophora macrospora TaxID=1851006 RepID=A0A0D2FP64_9EURO|nr:hypothetical protein PV04_04323 [Phialophora macrospora]